MVVSVCGVLFSHFSLLFQAFGESMILDMLESASLSVYKINTVYDLFSILLKFPNQSQDIRLSRKLI